jgi:hypothetical protein
MTRKKLLTMGMSLVLAAFGAAVPGLGAYSAWAAGAPVSVSTANHREQVQAPRWGDASGEQGEVEAPRWGDQGTEQGEVEAPRA